jgi:type I restriction enzyme S subunit
MSASNSILKEIREIVSFEKGKPPAQQPYFGSDAEIYLTPEYLRGGAATEPIKASANAVRVKQGDSIVLWDGSNAGEVFKAREGVLSSTMTRLRHGDEFDVSYFFYAVKGWESHLKGQTSGSGIPHVDKEVLGKLKIAKFPQAEQTKIAEILSTVDRAIEQTEALIAKQQRLKTGLMQDLLTRGIDEHGNLRSEQTHKFKDSPLGRIPVEWEVNMLGEIAEVRGGKRLPAGHSYSSADTGHRYFRVTDFYRKEIDYFSLEMLEEVTFRALRRYEIKQGDLCVSIAGSLGYFAHYLPPSEFQTILTENAARIVPKTGFIPSLLCSILNSDRVQMQIEEEKGVGGGVPKLALFRIRSLHVPLPSCENEQSRILGSLASQSEAFTATIIALSKLHSLKTALMQDLLTGRKMVTTLLDGKEAIE